MTSVPVQFSPETDLLTQRIERLTRRGSEENRAARERILSASPPPRDIPEGKSILDVLEGRWSGAETDAEIRDALDRIS